MDSMYGNTVIYEDNKSSNGASNGVLIFRNLCVSHVFMLFLPACHTIDRSAATFSFLKELFGPTFFSACLRASHATHITLTILFSVTRSLSLLVPILVLALPHRHDIIKTFTHHTQRSHNHFDQLPFIFQIRSCVGLFVAIISFLYCSNYPLRLESKQ